MKGLQTIDVQEIQKVTLSLRKDARCNVHPSSPATGQLWYNYVMAIQILDPQVAAKIAAGEVVERPVNVVKELVENSLDAGATEIRVEVREGGQRLLRVSDNGHGIPTDEVPLAFLRHATNKLTTAEDLSHIATFGFRGEALYSIAAVSQVTLTTRHRDEPFGTQIRAAGGQVEAAQRAGMPVGTIISVEHLFYNVPARQKFLRKATTEAGQIADLLQSFALAHPERRFSLVSEGRMVFQSTGSGQLFDVLSKVYGLEQAKQMVPVGAQRPERRPQYGQGATAVEDVADELWAEIQFMADDGGGRTTVAAPRPLLQVSGYASLPSLTRPNRSEIQLFVNRRPVEDRTLTHAVVQAYHTLLPVGRYPVAVLLVEIDPEQVDVNVHPQKSQVRFADDRAVFGAVQKAVRQAVMAHAPPPELVLPAPAPERWQPTTSTSTWGGAAAREPAQETAQDTAHTFAAIPASPPPSVQPPLDLPPPKPAPSAAPMAEQPSQPPVRPPLLAGRVSQLPPLRVVGQIGAMYIITEGPEGMYLIDQHAAHERILYEKLMAERADQAVAQQQLLQPIPLHVGTAVAGQVADHLEELRHIGFDIENFGSDTFLVRAVPSVLSGQDPLRALEEMVMALADRRNLAGEEHEARLVKLICKRAAIKAGQLLSELEMQELVRQLEECQSPRTCPHGRPTMIQLSASELEKAFGRV
jgi:DNA mismatch repair protein MutL